LGYEFGGQEVSYFEQKLKTILENRYLSDEWVTPDDIYYFSDALGGITFIDYNDDFVYGDIGETHPKVADRTEELEGQKRGTLLDHAILGRSYLVLLITTHHLLFHFGIWI
jgi:hypothetical protein